MALTPTSTTPASKPSVAREPQETRREKAKEAADALNQGLGMDGFVQDSTRVASLVVDRASSAARVLRVAADFTNGEGVAVERAVERTQQATHAAAASVAPRLGAAVDHSVAPALSGLGKAFKFASKWAQVAALPFAYLDVRTALKAKEPAEKRAAIANATFSVVGGIAGAIGGFAYATPVGLPLLVISSVSALFQLTDHFVTHDKGMDWIGEHVVKPLQGPGAR